MDAPEPFTAWNVGSPSSAPHKEVRRVHQEIVNALARPRRLRIARKILDELASNRRGVATGKPIDTENDELTVERHGDDVVPSHVRVTHTRDEPIRPGVGFAAMLIWSKGRSLIVDEYSRRFGAIEDALPRLVKRALARVPGTGVFMHGLEHDPRPARSRAHGRAPARCTSACFSSPW
jgi:hypothetical protein